MDLLSVQKKRGMEAPTQVFDDNLLLSQGTPVPEVEVLDFGALRSPILSKRCERVVMDKRRRPMTVAGAPRHVRGDDDLQVKPCTQE